MSLAVIGLNHRTAPVAIRERFAFADAELPAALADLRELPGIQESAILSTCNRTEIYVESDRPDDAELVLWLTGYHRARHEELVPYLFRHNEPETVRHALRVAAGLDSMLLGEPQILGQMKTAYQAAVAGKSVGKRLNRLFQHAFAVAKRIRTDTAIGSSPVSVAFAAVRLAAQIHGALKDRSALMIGAGDTIELVAAHLHEQGLGRLIVANRSIERAQMLASRYRGYAIGLADIGAHLADADIVVAATASRLPLLGKGAVETALRARRYRPMFLVDLAVPRNLESEIGDLDDAFLYTVDDLRDVIADNLRRREVAALQADEIVLAQTEHFLDWLRATEAAKTITELRARAQAVKTVVLQSAERQLASGADPHEVVEMMATKLINKLMHEPSVRMREAATEGRNEVLDAAIELFNLGARREP